MGDLAALTCRLGSQALSHNPNMTLFQCFHQLPIILAPLPFQMYPVGLTGIGPGLLCHMLPSPFPNFLSSIAPAVPVTAQWHLSQPSGCLFSVASLGLPWSSAKAGHCVLPLCEQMTLQLNQTSHPKRTDHGLQRWQTSRVKTHPRSPA